MNRSVLLLMLAATFFIHLQLFAADDLINEDCVMELVVFKVKDPLIGIKIAQSVVEDARAFNNGIIKDEIYQSANDPHVIVQRITWKSLEKAKEALAAFDTFPNASDLSEQLEDVIFFDHLKLVEK